MTESKSLGNIAHVLIKRFLILLYMYFNLGLLQDFVWQGETFVLTWFVN